MKMSEQLGKYNAVWVSMPAYTNLTPTTTSYNKVSHRNGKEMNEIRQYLPGVVTQSLHGGSPTQHSIFNHVIECIRAITEFNMYARYISHDDATLSYIEDVLNRLHTMKDIFLLGRARKIPNAKANTQRKELVQQRKVDEETNVETGTLSKEWRKRNAWWDYISYGMDVSMELDNDINFPKIYWTFHSAELICQYRTFDQYSAQEQKQ